MPESCSTTIDLINFRLSALARQLWQLAETAGRESLPAPRYLAVTGPTEPERRAVGEVVAQLLAAHGAVSSPTCTYLSAVNLMNESLQSWPRASTGFSALHSGAPGHSGVVMIEDLDALGLPSNDPASYIQAQAASAVTTDLLMAGERPGGAVICLSDTADAIDRVLDSEPALRTRFGRDYFPARIGPIAAAAKVFGGAVASAAWWHEVLEATNVSARSLQTVGVSSAVIGAVESVTRRDGETYAQLIDRACADPVGRLVQLVHNAWAITILASLATASESAASMLKDYYEPARDRLLIACDLDDKYFTAPEVAEMQSILDTFCSRPAR